MKIRVAMAMAALTMVLGAVGAPKAGAEVSGGWDFRTIGLNGTYFPLVGQFAGDAATDIFWYAPGTGADSLWIGKAGSRGANAFTKVPMTVNKSYIPVVGDFFGDDYTDILWYSPGTGADAVWVSANVPGYFTSQAITINGTFKPTVLHDFTAANRKDDILWYAPGSAGDYLWHFDESGSGAKTTKNLTMSATNYQVVVGDWNADLLDDVFLYAPGSTADYRWASKPDGTFATSRKDVTSTLKPVTVYQTTGDGILWWGDGTGKESYWVRSSATFASRTIPSVNVHASPTPGALQTVYIEAPTDIDGAFVGTSSGGDWYSLVDQASQSKHDQTSQLPVIGDFDDDDYADVIWYGAGTVKDELWYTAPGSSSSSRANPLQDQVRETPFQER
ncbi:MAG: hypothetical protein U0P45_08955 [Acidimicrobiales bacterium]